MRYRKNQLFILNIVPFHAKSGTKKEIPTQFSEFRKILIWIYQIKRTELYFLIYVFLKLVYH